MGSNSYDVLPLPQSCASPLTRLVEVPHEVQVLRRRTWEYPDQDYAVGIDGDNLADSRFGLMIANYNERSRRQLNTCLHVVDVRMGKAIPITSVVVQPQVKAVAHQGQPTGRKPGFALGESKQRSSLSMVSSSRSGSTMS